MVIIYIKNCFARKYSSLNYLLIVSFSYRVIVFLSIRYIFQGNPFKQCPCSIHKTLMGHSQLSFHHFALLRCFFVSASLDDKLYISSGLGLRSTAPNSWDIYHSDSDSWISHKNPLHNHDVIKLIALEGKLCTIHKSWDGFSYAGIYDPASATWQGIDNEIALSTYGPTVVVDGVLYMLHESSGMRLLKWQEERKEWVAIGRLSSHLTRPPCHLVAIGRSIYVIGQRLSTVVIDVDEAAKVEGLMVSSSFSPRFECDHTVISCNTITI